MTSKPAHSDPYFVPAQVPRQGGRFVRALSRGLLRINGWRFEGHLPNLRKFIVIGGPHTSNWDFFVTMGLIFGLGVDISWMAKHTFIEGPLSPLLQAMGGVPVDRTKSSGVVGQIVEQFKRREHFVLALSPEGTRSKVRRWKTGFYHMAHGAGVPIVPIALDYPDRRIAILPPFTPGGDIETDLPKIQQMYAGFRGQNPHQF